MDMLTRMISLFFACLLAITVSSAYATRVILNGKGGSDPQTGAMRFSTNEFDLIKRTLGAPPDTPDCTHHSFGKHLRMEHDPEMKERVFVFYLHAYHDGDPCTRVKRQRNEIYTYASSPRYLKGLRGDSVSYRWKFKLEKDFRPSTHYTHIHQIKPGDGKNGASPLITFTVRINEFGKQVLQIIHQGSGVQSILAETDLAPYKGNWVNVYEKVIFGYKGTYTAVIRPTNGETFTVNHPFIDMWRNGTTFMRPKWGMSRSLQDIKQLRDETIRFTDFCISNGKEICMNKFQE